MNIHKRYIIIVLFTILSLNISAQRLHREEVLWVLLHPFAAIKVVPIFKELKEMKSQFINHPQLDGLNAGGSSDALRHIYWMARMSQKIKVNKALKLGIAHEKANERYFRNGKNLSQDSVAIAMDLYNNKLGVTIGKENKKLDFSQILELAIKEIGEGKALMIKMDSSGNSLNCDSELLSDEEWKGKWRNERCLIPSRLVP